jgi:peptidoglycan hydrolase-like protein with peptidoglycan-binding domain
MQMKRLLRKLTIGMASVVALGIAGAALDYAADAGDAANAANMPAAFETWSGSGSSAQLQRDDIRWAQVELRLRGLCNGSLDGVVGPETRVALRRFQQSNGLDRTAALDPQTMQALTGSADTGQGSSTSPAEGTRSITTSSGTDK